jgi:hypothetical protein
MSTQKEESFKTSVMFCFTFERGKRDSGIVKLILICLGIVWVTFTIMYVAKYKLLYIQLNFN